MGKAIGSCLLSSKIFAMPRFRNLPLAETRVQDGFWSHWQARMAEHGLPHQWRQLAETGRLENLRRCARGLSGGFSGYRFNDSDVYKVLEASAYATTLGHGERIERHVAEAIDLVCAAQQTDGYINSFVQLDHPDMRWRSLNALHEMYCIGHLVEAGVAHFEATGRSRLLDASRAAAECMMGAFGPQGKLGYPDHQESELALAKLANATNDKRYEDYAAWQIRVRGTRPSPFEAELADPAVVALTPGVKALYFKDGVYDGAYAQDDVPLVDQTKPVGHAVRAVYNYCGAVDVLGDDAPTFAALSKIWDELVDKRMYVTGGIGSSSRNEGFSEDYDLPNQDAYAETCAGIGLVFWAWRMFLQTGHGKYVDVMQRALFNAVLSGVSESCDAYFYDNPLESDGRHRREPWFSCACCPPNIARLVLSVGQYFVARGDQEIAIALPTGGTYHTDLAKVHIESDYPWDGGYRVQVDDVRDLKRLNLHVPQWSSRWTLKVNGADQSAQLENGLVSIERDWTDGDVIVVENPMAPRWVRAHSRVLSCAGRVALERGPVVFCAEEHDNGTPPHRISVQTQGPTSPLSGASPYRKTLQIDGVLDSPCAEPLASAQTLDGPTPIRTTLVPYSSWANRGPNSMQVWLRRHD